MSEQNEVPGPESPKEEEQEDTHLPGHDEAQDDMPFGFDTDGYAEEATASPGPAPDDTPDDPVSAPGDAEQTEWPEELVRAAKVAPDHLIRIVDPSWQGDGEPPEWAVGGAWLTDSDGNIVEGEINEDYRPSPKALGWPEAIDSLDEAVQLSATGYVTDDVVVRQLAAAQVMVFLGPEGQPAVVEAPDGSDVVVVSSPSVEVDEETNPHVRMPVSELLELTGEEYDVYFLSPSAPVSVVVQVENLLNAMANMPGDADGITDSGAPMAVSAGREQESEAGSAPARPTESDAAAWDTSPTTGAAPAQPPVKDLTLPDSFVLADSALPDDSAPPRPAEQ